MKTFLTIAMTGLLLFVLASKTCGQPNDQNLEMKTFGVGLHMQQFKISEMDILMMPANKILFTFNRFNGSLRIEPEIGFAHLKHKYSDDYSLSMTGILLGVGVFDMNQRERTNIYWGVRFNYGRFKESSNAEWFESETYSSLSFGPALGVEYYFSNHFSIGGEISILFSTLKEDEDDDFLDNQIINTNTGLVLRFYF